MALDILKEMGYEVKYGPDIAPEQLKAERHNFGEVILSERLKSAIHTLNLNIPKDALDEAVRKVLRMSSPSLVAHNHQFHKMLVEGVEVEYRRKDGTIAGDHVRLFDFKHPNNNEFWQSTSLQSSRTTDRRPDMVIFVNGIPLVVIELKNPADEKATIWSAFNQLQTYKKQIPSLFNTMNPSHL